MFLTVPTLSTFTKVSTYKQRLSYHECKFCLDQPVVKINYNMALFIIKDN